MRRSLTLVRHAKSSWNDANLSDFERPLNKRGLENAPDMGRRLHAANYSVDRIISSPATRAITTAEFIASEIEFNFQKIERIENIYEASLSALVDLVASLNDNLQSVMLVGHNPGLTALCNFLSNAVLDNMPTCAVAQIHFDIDRWNSITKHSGKLVNFDYPKNK